MGDSAEGRQDLGAPDVVTKYREAGEVVNGALRAILAASKEGVSLASLCDIGDQFVDSTLATMYQKPVKGVKIRKGVASPTSASVNALCSNNRPLGPEEELLKAGDLVKVELGAHIDGYVTVGSHTFVVDPPDNKIEGRLADVIMAARTAEDAVMRTIAVGATNKAITGAIAKAAAAYGCTPVTGVLSYNMKRHVISGSRQIANRDNPEAKNEEFEIEDKETLSIDIQMSTGEGKPKQSDRKPSIYRRMVENSYMLKTALGRQFMAEVNRRYPTLPFCVKDMEDQRAMKVGIAEATRHDLLIPYGVLTEKQGEYVAQCRFTVLMLPTGAKRITGLDFDQRPLVKSTHTVQDADLLEILARPVGGKKAKKLGKGSPPPPTS